MAVGTVCSGKRTPGSGGRDCVHRVARAAVVGGVAAVLLVTSAPRRKVVGVVAVDVTLRALHGGSVHTGKREGGVVVIERRVGPGNRVVAGIAGCWEARGNVIGISGGAVLAHMALGAGTTGYGVAEVVAERGVLLVARVARGTRQVVSR